jgi:hypothetical protein
MRCPTTEDLKGLMTFLNDKIKKTQDLFELFHSHFSRIDQSIYVHYLCVLVVERHFSINFEQFMHDFVDSH